MTDEEWGTPSHGIRWAKKQAKLDNLDRKAKKLASLKSADAPVRGLDLVGYQNSRPELQALRRAFNAERDGEAEAVEFQDWIQFDREVKIIAFSEGDSSLDEVRSSTADKLGQYYERLVNGGGKTYIYRKGVQRMIRKLMPTTDRVLISNLDPAFGQKPAERAFVVLTD